MPDRKSYQLYHTNPALGGDFKIDIFTEVPNRSSILSNSKEILDIKYVGASMIYQRSGYSDNKNQKDYIQGKVGNIFKINKDRIYGTFENVFLPDIGNIFTNQNYITGTYRINDHKGSNIGNTHCSIISLYLDNLTEDFIENLSVILKFSTSGNEIIRKVINIGKNPLIFDYLKTRIITNSEKNGVYIDHSNRVCKVLGYDIEKSIIVEKESVDLYERMFGTQRPHLELMDILTSFFSDNFLILPQFITFGIYFDLNKLVWGLGSLSQYSEYEVSTEVFSTFKKQNGEEIKEILRKKDFFTNFQYIPGYVLGKPGVLNKKFKLRAPNLLDIKKDYNEYTELRDRNTIYNQKIVHWAWSDFDNLIFNHDPDFGNYKIKGGNIDKLLEDLYKKFKEDLLKDPKNKKLSEKEIEDLFKKYLLNNPDKIFDKGEKGKYGPNTGQNVDQYDKETDNIQWAGKVLLGAINETFEVLGSPNKFIEEGYFKLIAGDNRKKDSKKIYLLLQTTPDSPTYLQNYKTNPHTNSLINELSVIPYEINEKIKKPGYKKPHGYNDLIPRLYLKKDMENNTEYYVMYDPTIIEPNSEKDKLDFKNLGYQTRLPHYLTQGKLLKFLKEITDSINDYNKKIQEGRPDDITEKEKYYKNWLDLVNKLSGNKNKNKDNNINIYEPLSKRGILYRCYFNKPNVKLDYWIDFEDALKGKLGLEDRIKYKLAEYSTNTKNTNNFVYLDRPGGNIVPLLMDINDDKFINYIYFNNPNIEKNKLKIEDSEKYKEFPLPLGSFWYWTDYYTQKRHIDIDILNVDKNQGYDILNNISGNNPNKNTENIWFDKSVVIPLPKMVRYDNVNKDNIDKIEMNNISYYTTKIFHSGITEKSDLYDIIRELK